MAGPSRASRIRRGSPRSSRPCAMQMGDVPYNLPDERGHFGPYGGVFVAETLIRALDELKSQYARYRNDPDFVAEFEDELEHYVGRPSPVYHARRWSQQLGGAQIWLKREDVKRQAQNVFRMALLGAKVVPVESGSKTLKDALNEAMRDWVTNVETTFYIIGTVAGPHPYPMMVRDFQSVIGRECIEQMPKSAGRQPDAVIACVGGGSNAMGIFYPYIANEGVKLIGVEAAGEGIATGHHAASLTAGRPGVLHGNRTYLLQDDDGQIVETHSVSAGLDYPGVGPEHAWLKDTHRAQYVTITDDEALAAFHTCCRTEGIIPALESSHALAYAAKLAPTLAREAILLVNLSGRGDKDMNTVAERTGLHFYCRPECDPAKRTR